MLVRFSTKLELRARLGGGTDVRVNVAILATVALKRDIGALHHSTLKRSHTPFKRCHSLRLCLCCADKRANELLYAADTSLCKHCLAASELGRRRSGRRRLLLLLRRGVVIASAGAGARSLVDLGKLPAREGRWVSGRSQRLGGAGALPSS